MNRIPDKDNPPLTAVARAVDRGEAGFRIERGAGRGFVKITGRGFWSVEEVARHFDELQLILTRERKIRAEVRVLVDLRESGAQSAETIASIGARVARIYGEGDRVAIVLASILAKLQMRRVIRDVQHEMFVSPEAAEKWLMAYD